jgi:hypothetical protein
MHTDPKSAKKDNQVVCVFFALSRSVHTKKARRMLNEIDTRSD